MCICVIVLHDDQFEPVIDDCTAALELNPRYVKALLRRAQANEKLEKYDVALEGKHHLRLVELLQLVAMAIFFNGF